MATATSTRTEAAIQAARRALSAAVETAEADKTAAQADLNAAQAAVTKAQDYRAAQAAILDRLRPISDLATVETASTDAEAAEALTTAGNAVATATSTRTEAAIQAARRALSAAVETAEAYKIAAQTALDAAQAALTEAQNYRTAQTAVLDGLQPISAVTRYSDGSSGGQSRVTDLNITHVKMTDFLIVEGGSLPNTLLPIQQGRAKFSCLDSVPQNTNGEAGLSETGCTFVPARPIAPYFAITLETLVEGLRGASDQSNGFASLVPGGTINGIELAVRGEGGSLAGVGQYSAFSTHRGYDANQSFVSAQSEVFGERTARRPLGTATWRGAMVGTSISDSGPALAGEAVLAFSLADNEIDVEISNVRSYDDVSYTGPSSFSWSNLQVQSDGQFRRADAQNDHISGNFYGPNTEESAGVFERGSVVGAWLAKITTGN